MSDLSILTSAGNTETPPPVNPPRQPATNWSYVVVRDFDMPFGSMVGFMVKWALASIPAVLLVGLVVFAIFVLLGALGAGLGSLAK